MSQQEHGRTRNRYVDLGKNSDSSASISKASLASSIANFRCDFEDLKCKMTIFGESLNLCRCIADDFKNKLLRMEKRLQHLEKRQKNFCFKLG
ncbi:hypothetical protein MSG28_015501 [Choristoneura fumiferana]|uniref:Uncharacterized protein n=1 Tax=Choristoneura fumiferana TaxID=7141 RepID=A0ACC0KAD3_CHOFU|nr:hypothetical protein MSG28_015501 [Choristoneura fumiferana]